MEQLEPIKDVIPSEWVWVHSNFEVIVASLVLLGLLLTILRGCGVPVGDVWPWFRGLRLKGFFPSLRTLRHLQRLDDWWHWYRLKKGWRKMKVDLSHLTEYLDVNEESITKKGLVVITLSGGLQDIEEPDGTKIAEGNMLTRVKDERDRDILRNLATRNRTRFMVFLDHLAHSVVDDWDGSGAPGGVAGTQKNKTDQDRSDWIADYKIPSQVLMDYVGDLWDYEGHWSTE